MPNDFSQDLAGERNDAQARRRRRRQRQASVKLTQESKFSKTSPAVEETDSPFKKPSESLGAKGATVGERLAESLVLNAATKKRKSRTGKILQGALQGFLLGREIDRNRK